MRKKKFTLMITTLTIFVFGVAAFANPKNGLFGETILSLKVITEKILSPVTSREIENVGKDIAPLGQENAKVPDQPVENNIVPETILWHMVFTMPKRMAQEAEKLNQDGKDGNLWNEYFVRQAGLSKDEDTILKEMAAKYMEEIVPLDAKAKEIITEIRSRYPNGIIEKNQEHPQPPAELGELQAKRDGITIRYRDDFTRMLGASSSEAFSRFLREEFSSGIARIRHQSPRAMRAEGGETK